MPRPLRLETHSPLIGAVDQAFTFSRIIAGGQTPSAWAPVGGLRVGVCNVGRKL